MTIRQPSISRSRTFGGAYAASLILGIAATVTASASFAKELLVARQFGVGVPLDVYLAAFSVVTLLPTVIGVLLQATFVPTFSAIAHDRIDAAARFAVMLWLLTSAVLIASTAGVGLAAHTLVGFVAPGFSLAERERSVNLVYVLLPLIWLVASAELLKAQLNCFRSFALPAGSQILPSAGAIAGLIVLGRPIGIMALAIGWVVGSLAQLAILAVACLHRGMKLRTDRAALVDIRRLVRLGRPYVAVALFPWVLLLIDQNLASRLGPGSISILGYADKIFRIPLTILIAAIYTAAHPYLAEAVASRRYGDFHRFADQMAGLAIGILVPLGLTIVILRQPIVEIVYQRGAFTRAATDATSGVLAFLALQIPCLGVWYVYDRALICLSRTTFLMSIAGVAIGLKLVLSLVLMRWLGLPGLACATTVAIGVSATAMYAALHAQPESAGYLRPALDLARTVGAAVVAAGIAAAAAWVLSTGPARIPFSLLRDGLIVLVMAGAYAALIRLLTPGQVRALTGRLKEWRLGEGFQ